MRFNESGNIPPASESDRTITATTAAGTVACHAEVSD
ncbi:MAG: hypothetical protein SCAL_000159 [Candidatus Syntrophoarchaeum caldarius]|uniref:Uncharacterized protein n=1 Tax=Candidatus Syntropharchaeum caldarium TaxID=1838285 RepID=A0A1F2PB50_9EURY|nr:MAG: hypothetical protein SCAL_000159 [Candidatus Syntrophoarchaeum caldarius]